jgi:photosystem II stability/assembly factor-like uncharacterized protein
MVTLALAMAACGGTAAQRSATTHPTGTTGPRTTTTAAGPTGGPVPAGFVPQSFSAVSETQYWVLGTSSCGSGRCPALLRTTDGGASFASISAPPITASFSGEQPTLRFADRLDGYAFLTNGPSTVFFTTHDGANTWHAALLGDILAFATGAGQALVVSARCGNSGCSDYALERSPVGHDAWSATQLPFAPTGSLLDLEAHGANLWLMGTPASANGPNDGVLARSSDSGGHFTVRRSPCLPGLGGRLSPTSATEIWALCPTGMEAGTLRSTDGGATFSAIETPPLPNSAELAPATVDVAVLAPNDATGTLLRTTDGGVSWNPATTPPGAKFWPWIGFTDTDVGSALVQTASATALWRTTDGGAHWLPVSFG